MERLQKPNITSVQNSNGTSKCKRVLYSHDTTIRIRIYAKT